MIFETNSMKMPTGSARVPPSSSTTRSINPNGPVMVEHKNMKFLITDRPTNATLPQFIEELKKYKAHVVVRVCEPTYNTEALAKEGITVVVSFLHILFCVRAFVCRRVVWSQWELSRDAFFGSDHVDRGYEFNASNLGVS